MAARGARAAGRATANWIHKRAAFWKGLGEAGYVEGDTVLVEYRWANGDYSRLPGLAADLLARKVLVLVAVGGDASAAAAKQATSSVPVVFGMGSDPDGTVNGSNQI